MKHKRGQGVERGKEEEMNRYKGHLHRLPHTSDVATLARIWHSWAGDDSDISERDIPATRTSGTRPGFELGPPPGSGGAGMGSGPPYAPMFPA